MQEKLATAILLLNMHGVRLSLALCPLANNFLN